METELFHADGRMHARTDMRKLTVASRNFANALKIKKKINTLSRVRQVAFIRWTTTDTLWTFRSLPCQARLRASLSFPKNKTSSFPETAYFSVTMQRDKDSKCNTNFRILYKCICFPFDTTIPDEIIMKLQ